MDKSVLRTILIFLMSSLVFLGMCSTAFGQVSADPSDPTAIGYSKETHRKASPWTLASSVSAIRGLDEFAKVYLSYSASAIYRLKHRQVVSANLSYSAPASGVATFPEDFGFEDIALSYTKRNIFKIFEKTNTSLRLSSVLPTSETSQRASLKGAVSASLPTSFRWKNNIFVISPRVGLALHKYETNNNGGERVNSPFNTGVSFVASRSLYKRISGALSAGYITLADYDFNFRQIQSVGLSMTVPVYKKTSLTGGYSWRDRVISNNAAFDDDRSKYFLSLSTVL